MSLRRVFGVVGLVQVFVGLAMAAAGLVALVYAEGDAAGIFLASGSTVAIGSILFFLGRFQGDLTPPESFAIVTFSWLAAGVTGALPFVLTGAIPRFAPAVFEALSGFTTTGATVIPRVETLPHGILFWRAITQWMGGMGILVLAVAILPFLGVGGMQLFKAEAPGIAPERLRPRIAQTAKLLWMVYLGLTLLQILLLMSGGLDLFDATTHTFTTLATGGFSTKTASIAHYSSPYIQYIFVLFMYLAGVNFALHFRAATGRLEYFRDHEWRFYTLLLVGAALLVTGINLTQGDYSLSLRGAEKAFRDSLFQVVSVGTTTGYVTTDYEGWRPAAQMVLFILFFSGGMAGSTGGSLKSVRVLLLLKQTGMEIRKHLHPRAVLLARVGKRVVREDVLANVIAFTILYTLLFVAGALALTFLGADLLTALGASAATMGNVGPGFGEVGPVDHYGWISDPGLAVLSFLMVAGRLEVYTVLLLFHPETWRGRR